MHPRTIEQRQMQTRRFTTTDEANILAASAALLQDLGFTLDASETELGLIVASKDREAVEAGQVIGAIIYFALVGTTIPIDSYQKIRASIVTRPVGHEIAVRVTFQRTVWNTDNQVTRLEPLNDPEVYNEFFAKLSKAVFLEAHEI